MKLVNDYVVLQLPDDTNSDSAKHGGFSYSRRMADVAATRNDFLRNFKEGQPINPERTYAPTSGIVVDAGKSEKLQVGDRAFFDGNATLMARPTAENLRDGGYRFDKFVYEENGGVYFIIPHTQLYFALRNSQYVALNKNVVLRRTLLDKPKFEISGALWENLAEVAASPNDWLKEGDIVVPSAAWNVPLDNSMLKELPEELYFIHEQYIHAICQ